MSQRVSEYYNRTAGEYDQLHGGEENLEHVRALERAWPMLAGVEIRSALDVGCGTGRSLAWLSARRPSLELRGLDPSEKVLAIARQRVPGARLEVGLGETLPMEDSSVDLALATGIMHHVDDPSRVIRELFRVARRAVLISDHNNFAFGGPGARRLRLWLHASGLLGLFTYLRQGFRRQGYTEADGWWYPYSLLNDYGLISSLCPQITLIPTRPTTDVEGNLLIAQSHLAILAIKPPPEAG